MKCKWFWAILPALLLALLLLPAGVKVKAVDLEEMTLPEENCTISWSEESSCLGQIDVSSLELKFTESITI